MTQSNSWEQDTYESASFDLLQTLVHVVFIMTQSQVYSNNLSLTWETDYLLCPFIFCQYWLECCVSSVCTDMYLCLSAHVSLFLAATLASRTTVTDACSCCGNCRYSLSPLLSAVQRRQAEHRQTGGLLIIYCFCFWATSSVSSRSSISYAALPFTV